MLAVKTVTPRNRTRSGARRASTRLPTSRDPATSRTVRCRPCLAPSIPAGRGRRRRSRSTSGAALAEGWPAMAGRDRIGALVRRHLDPSAVSGLGPAVASAAALDLDVIALSMAFADRPGLLLLTAAELRFVSADAADQASAFLDRVATAEVAVYEDRPVLVVLGSDSRRTMFTVGDAEWTRTFAGWVNLALDDPEAAVVAVDRHGRHGPAAGTASAPPAPAAAADPRPARERLAELEELRRDGILTDHEYRAQRAAIISQV